MRQLKKVYQFSFAIGQRFFEKRCSVMVAALAYSTLLSLVPFMIVCVTILSYFPIFKGTGNMIQTYLLSNFVASSATQITQHFRHFLDQMQDLSWVNLSALVVVSILLMYNMVQAFNEIWAVKLHRHLALSLAIYFLILLLLPLALGLLMLMSSYVTSLSFIAHFSGISIKKPLFILLPYLTSLITFTLLNWALPSCKVRFYYALLAGFFTTTLFEAVKWGFAWYLHYFSSYQIIYGALASIPLFIVWIYTCWTLILLGALFCYELHTLR